MNRIKSLNITMVFYMFLVMLFASLVTTLAFVLFYSMGILPFLLLTPILSPLIALLMSSVIGTSISALASDRVLKPVNELIRATDVVSKGDFSVRVAEISSDTEIAKLLRNFNHMTEELGSIEMFRDDFINDFSHEFKTPIVSIQGFARQLQDEGLSPEKRKEYTDIIIRESERLTTMSSNVLLLAKFENQQIITDKAEYDLDEQIRNCAILLEKQWARKGLDLDLALEPARVCANEEMLAHLWINLLDNAIKYSQEGGRVTVSCADEGGAIRVTIADDGIGMDEATLKHIFEKFYQGDPSHAARGNGLGLPIAKRIVELYGGTIAVESSPGKGSRFTVCLPGTGTGAAAAG
jgi:signal transduction histidine kinase